MYENKPVLGLGKDVLPLPHRKSSGAGTSTSTSHGTHDFNAPHQEQNPQSVVTDSHGKGAPPPSLPATVPNSNPLFLHRNINHAAASGITGAPKESEIITIGSPDDNEEEGVGAASAEPLLAIEETSLQNTVSGINDEPSGSRRRNRTDARGYTTAEVVDEGALSSLLEAQPAPLKNSGGRTTRTTRRAKRGEESEEAEKRPKKRVRKTATTTKNTSKTSLLPKNSELIGHEVEVPGSVFFVTHPEYFIGYIKRRDPQRRNAVEVTFRDDPSVYWFPIKDVAEWMEDQKHRDQEEFMMEEGKQEEEGKFPAMTPLEPPMLPYGSNAKAWNGLNEVERKNSIFDEELAAQALTDMSVSGGKISVTVSRSGGDGDGDGDGDRDDGVSSGAAAAETIMKRSGDKGANERGPSRLRDVTN